MVSISTRGMDHQGGAPRSFRRQYGEPQMPNCRVHEHIPGIPNRPNSMCTDSSDSKPAANLPSEANFRTVQANRVSRRLGVTVFCGCTGFVLSPGRPDTSHDREHGEKVGKTTQCEHMLTLCGPCRLYYKARIYNNLTQYARHTKTKTAQQSQLPKYGKCTALRRLHRAISYPALSLHNPRHGVPEMFHVKLCSYTRHAQRSMA